MREVLRKLAQVPFSALVIGGETGTGQGPGDAHSPLQRAAYRGPAGRDQLRRAAARAARVRAVRPRGRRLHRRAQAPARPHRAGERRHALPRRDRRARARPAGEAAQGDRGSARAPARLGARGGGRRAAHCREQPRPRGASSGQALSASDLFHRLSVFGLSLPSLRERLDDLEDLVPAIVRGVQRALGQERPRTIPDRRVGGAARLRLAGQRARAAQRDRALRRCSPTATCSRRNGCSCPAQTRGCAARRPSLPTPVRDRLSLPLDGSHVARRHGSPHRRRARSHAPTAT